MPASKEQAALACSRLPVLEYFRDGPFRTLVAGLVGILNVALLAVFVHYFYTACTTQYGILPSESPPSDAASDYVPLALAELDGQARVTMIQRSLIYYSAVHTFERDVTVDGEETEASYWVPLEQTCGCGTVDTCNLESCAGTIPIVVKYEQCPTLLEAFALATGLMVWVNMALTAVGAMALLLPCWRRAEKINFWDFVKIGSLQWDTAVGV